MGNENLGKVRDVLNALARTSGTPGDLPGMLQHIALTARTHFKADSAIIFASNPISGRFLSTLTIEKNFSDEDEVFYAGFQSEELARRVLKHGVLLVEDLAAASEFQRMLEYPQGVRSLIALPLKIQRYQKQLGVLYLNFRQPQNFQVDAIRLLEVYADQASFFLEETWLLRRYQEVSRIGEELNHELETVDILFQKLQKYCLDIFDPANALLLAVSQPQTNTLDVYLQEEGRTTFEINVPIEGVCQHVVETRQTQVYGHFSEDVKHLSFRHVEMNTGVETRESLIFVPLEFQHISLGVLSIQHPQPQAHNQEDIAILQLLAPHIALALHHLRLYHNLDQLSKTGRLLTQQLDSESALQAIVDKIWDATKADIVVLYPYDLAFHRFVLPPVVAGTLMDVHVPSMTLGQTGGTMALMLSRMDPIFAHESANFYQELHGDAHAGQGGYVHNEKIRSLAAIPLCVGEEKVGVIFFNFRQQQYFDDTQQLFINGLAHNAAVAIKNVRLFGSLMQRRVRELEILQNIDRELSRNLELQPVLDTLLKLGHERVPADGASILLYDNHLKALVTSVAVGLHRNSTHGFVIPLQETRGITRWVLEQKKPARVNNVHLDLQWRDIYIATSDETISELDVPLLDGNEVIGVFNFESTKEGTFRQEDEDFLCTLAGQAVLAVKNAQAYEREKRLSAEAQVLNEINKEITSQLDLAHVFDLILEKALALTHSSLGSLHLYDPVQDDLWLAANRGVVDEQKKVRLKLNQGVVGRVAAEKCMFNVKDVSKSPWNETFIEIFPDAHSELAVPLLAGNELRGVLNIESPVIENFTEHDERLLKGLAGLAVVALQNAQAFEREKRLLEEAQLLNAISKEITSQLDYVRVFDLIMAKALELTGSLEGALLLYNPELNDLWIGAERGLAREKKDARLNLQQGIVGYVARNKLRVNADLTRSPWKDMHLPFVPGMRSELAVPMLAREKVRGVLYVESPNVHNFNESDERLLQGLADLAVVALQNAERFEQARTVAQRFEWLYQAGQELGKISELTQIEQAYNIILDILARYCNGQIVLRRYQEETQELVTIRALQHHYAHPFSRMHLDEGINGQVARERRPVIIADTHNLPEGASTPKLSDPTVRSLIILPVLFKEQYYGNLGISHQEIGHFHRADLHFLEGLTQQLASTMYRLETVQERHEFEQRAQAAEIMSSVGQLAFELTHRLDNDLGPVELYVNHIQDELKKLNVISPFIAVKLDEIVQTVQTVLNISDKLMHEFADMHAVEEQAEEPDAIAAKELFEKARSLLPLPEHVKVQLEVADDVGCVLAVAANVIDIFRHLIGNALEAMPAGGRITLQAHNAGRYVALAVSDTGIGIPEQLQSKVFELFYSTKGSTGFGLWSARRYALRNHGALKVRSIPGRGTTFTLLLPRVDR